MLKWSSLKSSQFLYVQAQTAVYISLVKTFFPPFNSKQAPAYFNLTHVHNSDSQLRVAGTSRESKVNVC